MESFDTYQFVPWLSRESLSGSSVTSPNTPTFSVPSHSRHASSSSSIATSPDSPVNIAKSSLDDLPEDPAERDDIHGEAEPSAASNEPLCICRLPVILIFGSS